MDDPFSKGFAQGIEAAIEKIDRERLLAAKHGFDVTATSLRGLIITLRALSPPLSDPLPRRSSTEAFDGGRLD